MSHAASKWSNNFGMKGLSVLSHVASPTRTIELKRIHSHTSEENPFLYVRYMFAKRKVDFLPTNDVHPPPTDLVDGSRLSTLPI